MKPTSVNYHWKAPLDTQILIIWYFIYNENPATVYKKMCCALLSKVCPRTISKYLLDMRTRLAKADIDSLQTKLIQGPWEADETWCRVKRKFNRGRFIKRKHSMVKIECICLLDLALF